MAVLAEPFSELPDRRRLPGAVHADDEQDARIRVDLERRRLSEERGELLRERSIQVGEVRTALEPLHELGRRAHADVGANQRLLEPLPGRVVTGIERRGRKLGRERAPALRERVAQAREQSGAILLGLWLCVLLAEELAPRSRHEPQTVASAASDETAACGSIVTLS